MIRAFFARRRAAAIERRYTEGYNYGAGALLGGTSFHQLEGEISIFAHDDFDRGIAMAMFDWRRMQADMRRRVRALA